VALEAQRVEVEVEVRQIPLEVLVLKMNTVIREYPYPERNLLDINTTYHGIPCGHHKAAMMVDE
jgi:hypothetical protein